MAGTRRQGRAVQQAPAALQRRQYRLPAGQRRLPGLSATACQLAPKAAHPPPTLEQPPRPCAPTTAAPTATTTPPTSRPAHRRRATAPRAALVCGGGGRRSCPWPTQPGRRHAATFLLHRQPDPAGRRRAASAWTTPPPTAPRQAAARLHRATGTATSPRARIHPDRRSRSATTACRKPTKPSSVDSTTPAARCWAMRGTSTIVNDDVTRLPIHADPGQRRALAARQPAVSTTGIVTGRKSNGFFLQTPRRRSRRRSGDFARRVRVHQQSRRRPRRRWATGCGSAAR